MNQKSKTIVFFGTENFSLASLKALVENKFSVAAVVTKPDSRRGRSKTDTFPEVKKYALEQKIPVWQPNKISEIQPKIKELGENPTGVLVSFGKIIPKEIIDFFDPGIINLHPSLLPKYRGSTPIETAILNGDQEIGVSLMQLDPKMDAGPIYSQEKIDINGQIWSKQEYYKILSNLGNKILIRDLPRIMTHDLIPTPQNEADATYTRLLDKNDALVNPTKINASELERKIRAHQSFPKTKIVFEDQELIILKAKIADVASENTLSCKNNTLLEIISLRSVKTGKQMTLAQFKAGLHHQ